MDIFMLIVVLGVAIASLVIGVMALQRLAKLERMLEVPNAKKLNPELKLKLHKKGNLYQQGAKIEEVVESESNPRNSRNSKGSHKSGTKELRDPREGRESRESRDPRENREGRELRDPRESRAQAAPAPVAQVREVAKDQAKDARGDDSRNRRRGRNRPRFEASSEVVSNMENASSEEVRYEETRPVAPVAAPAPQAPVASPVAAPAVVEAPERPEGRPALAPRGQRSESVSPVVQAVIEEDAPVLIDASNIRHGRRNLVRRVNVEDDN
jgi:hypothetical protein